MKIGFNGASGFREEGIEYYGNIIQLFMLQQAVVQNIFPEVQVPTLHAIARGEAEVNSMSSRYLHRGENVLHYCLLEITVLLPNYIYSHVTYHVTWQ